MLFDQVAASMPQEGVLAHTQARMREIRARVYSKPGPYKEAVIEPEVVMVPEPLKPDPKMVIWDRCNALALQCLHDTEVITPKKPYKALADILREVSRKHRIGVNDIKKIDGYASRKQPIVIARQEFFFKACNEKVDGETVYSLPRIGMFLGGFDHTTVLHGRKAHAKRMKGARD